MAKNQAPVTAPVTAPVIARDAKVATLISKAGRAAGSVVQFCRDAAKLAATQLDPKKPVGARIAEVVTLYAKDFSDAGHNVRAIFVDALTLYACPTSQVFVEVIGKDGTKAEQISDAVDAVDMSKHTLRDAAKQVRDEHGLGRKSGAGRKAEATAPAAAAAPVTIKSVSSVEDIFQATLETLSGYMSDAFYAPRINAFLAQTGWALTRVAIKAPPKGRIIKGSGTSDVTPAAKTAPVAQPAPF